MRASWCQPAGRALRGPSKESAWCGVGPAAPPSAAPGPGRVCGAEARRQAGPISLGRSHLTPGTVIPVIPTRGSCGGGRCWDAPSAHLEERGWSQPGPHWLGRWVTAQGPAGHRGRGRLPGRAAQLDGPARATPVLRSTPCAPARGARHQPPSPPGSHLPWSRPHRSLNTM